MEHSTTIGGGALPKTLGTGLDTGVHVTSGEMLWITADGCWAAGINDASRTSDANGLVSGGTNPCSDSAWPGGQWTQGGLTANFGSLVGQIGSGDFFVIGTDFNQMITETGVLSLYYFDSDNFNNEGSVEVKILKQGQENQEENLPEPATLALLGAGLTGIGFTRRKRSAKK